MAKTIEQIQQMITDGYDQRQIINELADYLQANPSGGGGGGSSYLSYEVLLIQNGTDAPAVYKTIENTLGDVVWTRDGQGQYLATLAGAFPIDKTGFVVTSANRFWYYTAYQENVNQVYLKSSLISDQTFQDSLLDATYFKITVKQ